MAEERRSMGIAVGSALTTAGIVVLVTYVVAAAHPSWSGSVAVLSYVVLGAGLGVLVLVEIAIRRDAKRRKAHQRAVGAFIREGSDLLPKLNDPADENVGSVGNQVVDWNLRLMRWMEENQPEDAALLALHHNRGGFQEDHREFLRNQTEGRLESLERIYQRL